MARNANGLTPLSNNTLRPKGFSTEAQPAQYLRLVVHQRRLGPRHELPFRGRVEGLGDKRLQRGEGLHKNTAIHPPPPPKKIPPIGVEGVRGGAGMRSGGNWEWKKTMCPNQILERVAPTANIHTNPHSRTPNFTIPCEPRDRQEEKKKHMSLPTHPPTHQRTHTLLAQRG